MSTEKLASLYSNHSSLQYHHGKALIQQCLVESKNDKHGLRILDLGCGTGALTRELASFPFTASVLGIDPDKGRIQVAKKELTDKILAYSSKIQFLTGTIHDAKQHGPFDVIFSNFVLHWVSDDDIQDTMIDLQHSLKPGGLLIANITRDTGELANDLAWMTAGKGEEAITGMTFRSVGFWQKWCKTVGLDVEYSYESKTSPIMFPSVFEYFDFVKAYTCGASDYHRLTEEQLREICTKHGIVLPSDEYLLVGKYICLVARKNTDAHVPANSSFSCKIE